MHSLNTGTLNPQNRRIHLSPLDINVKHSTTNEREHNERGIHSNLMKENHRPLIPMNQHSHRSTMTSGKYILFFLHFLQKCVNILAQLPILVFVFHIFGQTT